MSKSKIGWTDRTWMVTGGCTKVTTACDRCYAIGQSHRSSAPGRKYHGLTKRGKHGTEWTGDITLFEHALADPYKWRDPCRVFVNSLSDLFHPDVPFSFIQRAFNVMLSTPHTYQVLTKRPERMAEFIDRIVWNSPKNIHLGFSAHDQPSFEKGWKHMQGIPASVLFVSLEPLLGPVDLSSCEDNFLKFNSLIRYSDNWGAGHPEHPTARIDWVIVGGESGPGARPMDLQWARDVRDQCHEANVPFFMKQIDKKQPIPADLMVRQFPEVG